MTTERKESGSALDNPADQTAEPAADRFEGMSDDEIVAVLQEELARLTLEQARAVELEQTLRAKEDPATKTYFAQEIFAAQQDRLRLGVEIELRQKKINRIRRGFSEAPGPVSDDVKNGFLF